MPSGTQSRSSLARRVRRWHRWLGVIIGVQFLAWVLGGLYFSWVDLDTVHGDDRRGPGPEIASALRPAPLDPILGELAGTRPDFRLQRVELRPLAQGALYAIHFSEAGEARSPQLVDAATGEGRGPLTEAESRALAASFYDGKGTIAAHRFLESAGPHHEYRGLPLPAHVFEFDDARRTRVYVAPHLGRVTSFRNHSWRGFDFLWMLHTMDYAGRDNFNNWLLRGFSILGLITVLSGFWLFFLTRRPRA